ncbi:MAG: radical SAM protein [Desulfatibacillaceae bacterium]
MGHAANSDMYAVPVGRDRLVVSPLRGVAILANAEVVERIRRGGPGVAEVVETALLAKPAPEPPARRSGPVDPLFVGLIPTRGCNLSCAYCDFGADGADAGEAMDPVIAVRAVDWAIHCAKGMGRDGFEIHFFGGEPFCAPEAVEAAVHRARVAGGRESLVPRLQATTNGAYGEGWAEFAGDYLDGVVLSLDGDRDVHDLHRSNSHAAAWRTAKILSRSRTDFCVRMCVSQKSVHRLPEMAGTIARDLAPRVLDVEALVRNERAARAGLLPPDPFLFATNAWLALGAARRMGVEAVVASADVRHPRASFCPVGQDALIVRPGGAVSGCYLPPEQWRARGMDMDVGWMTPGGIHLVMAALEAQRSLPLDKPRCGRCFCRHTCAGGCHVNQTFPGCGTGYTDFCLRTRVLSACEYLSAMGMADAARALVEDRGAMEALANNPDDRIGE